MEYYYGVLCRKNRMLRIYDAKALGSTRPSADLGRRLGRTSAKIQPNLIGGEGSIEI